MGINTTYSSNTYTTIALQYEYVYVSHFVSNSSNINTILRTTHCCSRGGSRSAAAGKGRRGRGGEATEDGFGRAGGDTSGVAASLTASVRLALTGSKIWQRLADGYRSAHQGKSFSGLPMNVLPGVSFRKLCFRHRYYQRMVPPGSIF